MVGPDVTLTDVYVGEGASVVRTHATQAHIGPGATVGPYAYLRPGTVLHERSKAGTFVEVKNAGIGERSKVPHLSYIGDAEIGEDTNIGAGAITANYDGFRKHRTRVGDRVRIPIPAATGSCTSFARRRRLFRIGLFDRRRLEQTQRAGCVHAEVRFRVPRRPVMRWLRGGVHDRRGR